MKEEEEKEIIELAHKSFIHQLSYLSTKFCFLFWEDTGGPEKGRWW